MAVEIGSYMEFKNAKGEITARLVCVGENTVQVYRQYRSLVTNEISDWQPSERDGENRPQPLSQQQIDAWAPAGKM